MKSQHTPGPWRIRELIGDDGRIEHQIATMADSDGFGKPIATVNYLDSESRSANAALIADAPELLAALEDAEFLLRKAAQVSGPMQDSFRRSAEDARSAISKARGEQ